MFCSLPGTLPVEATWKILQAYSTTEMQASEDGFLGKSIDISLNHFL